MRNASLYFFLYEQHICSGVSTIERHMPWCVVYKENNMIFDNLKNVLTKMTIDDNNTDYGYGLFSLRLIGFTVFGATFNLVTCVGLP